MTGLLAGSAKTAVTTSLSIHALVGRLTDNPNPVCILEKTILPPLVAEPSDAPFLFKAVTVMPLEILPPTFKA